MVHRRLDSTAVRNIRRPNTMGEEWPGGMGTDHSALPARISAGRRAPSLTPVPLGPRKRGQSEACTVTAASARYNRTLPGREHIRTSSGAISERNMKDNRLQRVVKQGRVPVGHMVWEFGTRGIAKIAESADIDFVLIDMEHSGFDNERVANLLAWFKATDIAPFVRIPQHLYHFAARVMDGGALGVMAPIVESAEQARTIVDAVKYLPLGKRGVGLGTAHTDFLNPDPAAYFKRSNENTTIICQIESVAGLKNAEAIAATPGVDILWVGHFDLSNSMGIPAQFQHPQFLEALAKVPAVARQYGKLAGIQPGTMEQAEAWIQAGYNVISWGADSAVYARALREGVAGVRKRTGSK
jgi:2-dehydro-3-deoxyglucarate aldolase/4-hydroxy-2-oxoheptanedioate aldolase